MWFAVTRWRLPLMSWNVWCGTTRQTRNLSHVDLMAAGIWQDGEEEREIEGTEKEKSTDFPVFAVWFVIVWNGRWALRQRFECGFQTPKYSISGVCLSTRIARCRMATWQPNAQINSISKSRLSGSGKYDEYLSTSVMYGTHQCSHMPVRWRTRHI